MKRGLSQVITTVLLIVLVSVTGIIIFSALNGITGEIVLIDGKNIVLICQEVKFQLEYEEGILYIYNIGNIKIEKIKAKIFADATYKTIDADEFLENWPLEGLPSGGAFSGSANFGEDVQKIIILPVLKGETTNGEEKTYICSEEWGMEINY